MTVKTVKAKNLQPGDMLVHGDLLGLVVAGVAEQDDGRIAITLRNGRRIDTIDADPHQRVDIDRG